jgi:hypothetical protein
MELNDVLIRLFIQNSYLEAYINERENFFKKIPLHISERLKELDVEQIKRFSIELKTKRKSGIKRLLPTFFTLNNSENILNHYISKVLLSSTNGNLYLVDSSKFIEFAKKEMNNGIQVAIGEYELALAKLRISESSITSYTENLNYGFDEYVIVSDGIEIVALPIDVKVFLNLYDSLCKSTIVDMELTSDVYALKNSYLLLSQTDVEMFSMLSIDYLTFQIIKEATTKYIKLSKLNNLVSKELFVKEENMKEYNDAFNKSIKILLSRNILTINRSDENENLSNY